MNLNYLYLETERLILRPFTEADIEPSYEMNLDADVSKYTGDGGVLSLVEIEKRIRGNVFGDYKKQGYGRLAVELKDKPGFIGFAGLKYLEDYKEVDLGYRFMKEYWGKGYATEAAEACLNLGFNELKIDRIIAWVLDENVNSINVLKKVGFTFDKEIEDEGEIIQQYRCYKPQISND